jgi:hypothetical protein
MIDEWVIAEAARRLAAAAPGARVILFGSQARGEADHRDLARELLGRARDDELAANAAARRRGIRCDRLHAVLTLHPENVQIKAAWKGDMDVSGAPGRNHPSRSIHGVEMDVFRVVAVS